MSTDTPLPDRQFTPTPESQAMGNGIQPDTGNGWPRRFSWPMRIFLAYFLFDMVVLSFVQLTPYASWMERFSISTSPDNAMPSPADVHALIVGEATKNHESLAQLSLGMASDVANYYLPTASETASEKLQSPGDYGEYTIAWLTSRLRFTSRLFGVNQGWPMYSPGVVKAEQFGRLRLVFDDGTTEIHRSPADPVDLTSFSRWWNKRPLQFAVQLARNDDARRGYCHWMANSRPLNDRGATLVRIEVFTVDIEFPAPGEDIYECFAQQNTPLADSASKAVWEYDVATKVGWRLTK